MSHNLTATMPRANIAIIEDDPVFQTVVRQYLVSNGYEVCCADDGLQGINMCRQYSPDIVLCDLHLPDMNGLTVIEKLLTLCTHIPIVVISASEKMSDIRDAVRLGASDYLVKPLDSLIVIENAIEQCLRRYQLEESHLQDVWELDSYVEMLLDEEAMASQLTDKLLPDSELTFNHYQLDCDFDDGGQAPVWVDYRPLTEGRVFVVMAAAHNATEQSLLPLLVLKTFIDPLIRQCLSGHDRRLLSPGVLLSYLNQELCHTRVRTAFDALVGILDTNNSQWVWAQAGDRLSLEPGAKPDLAMGIWQQATYRTHCVTDVSYTRCDYQGTTLTMKRLPDIV